KYQPPRRSTTFLIQPGCRPALLRGDGLGVRGRVEIDSERGDLAASHREQLRDIAAEAASVRGAQLVTSQRAGAVSLRDQSAELEGANHRIESLGRLEDRVAPRQLLHRARVARELHPICKEVLPAGAALEALEIGLDRLPRRHRILLVISSDS